MSKLLVKKRARTYMENAFSFGSRFLDASVNGHGKMEYKPVKMNVEKTHRKSSLNLCALNTPLRKTSYSSLQYSPSDSPQNLSSKFDYMIDFIDKETAKFIMEGKSIKDPSERKLSFDDIFMHPVEVAMLSSAKPKVPKRRRLLSCETVVSGTAPLQSCSSVVSSSDEIDENKVMQSNRKSPVVVGGTCSCKKSECLKLYCECFANGTACGPGCSCKNCLNNDFSSQKTVAANELQPKLSEDKARVSIGSQGSFYSTMSTSTFDMLRSERLTPDSIKRKQAIRKVLKRDPTAFKKLKRKSGCNCKKSGCTKRYCECYSHGMGCSDGCNCVGCKNPNERQ